MDPPTPDDKRRRSARNTRIPIRYREEDESELPPKPLFLIPDAKFNPRLTSCFPTIPLGTYPEKKEEPERPTTPACVFRDTRMQPPVETSDGEARRHDDDADVNWPMDAGLEGLGHYEETTDEHGETFGGRVYIEALMALQWEGFSTGAQFVLIRELLREMHFGKAAMFLDIEDCWLEELVDVLKKENDNANAIYDAKEKSTAAGLAVLARYGTMEEWDAATAEAEKDMPEPLTHYVSALDVKYLKRFVGDFRVLDELEPYFDKDPIPSAEKIAEIRAIYPTQAAIDRVKVRLNDWKDKEFTFWDMGFEDGWADDLFVVYGERHNELEQPKDGGAPARLEGEHNNAVASNVVVEKVDKRVPAATANPSRPQGRLQKDTASYQADGFEEIAPPAPVTNSATKKKSVPAATKQVKNATAATQAPKRSHKKKEKSTNTTSHYSTVAKPKVTNKNNTPAPKVTTKPAHNAYPSTTEGSVQNIVKLDMPPPPIPPKKLDTVKKAPKNKSGPGMMHPASFYNDTPQMSAGHKAALTSKHLGSSAVRPASIAPATPTAESTLTKNPAGMNAQAPNIGRASSAVENAQRSNMTGNQQGVPGASAKSQNGNASADRENIAMNSGAPKTGQVSPQNGNTNAGPDPRRLQASGIINSQHHLLQRNAMNENRSTSNSTPGTNQNNSSHTKGNYQTPHADFTTSQSETNGHINGGARKFVAPMASMLQTPCTLPGPHPTNSINNGVVHGMTPHQPLPAGPYIANNTLQNGRPQMQGQNFIQNQSDTISQSYQAIPPAFQKTKPQSVRENGSPAVNQLSGTGLDTWQKNAAKLEKAKAAQDAAAGSQPNIASPQCIKGSTLNAGAQDPYSPEGTVSEPHSMNSTLSSGEQMDQTIAASSLLSTKTTADLPQCPVRKAQDAAASLSSTLSGIKASTQAEKHAAIDADINPSPTKRRRTSEPEPISAAEEQASMSSIFSLETGETVTEEPTIDANETEQLSPATADSSPATSKPTLLDYVTAKGTKHALDVPADDPSPSKKRRIDDDAPANVTPPPFSVNQITFLGEDAAEHSSADSTPTKKRKTSVHKAHGSEAIDYMLGGESPTATSQLHQTKEQEQHQTNDNASQAESAPNKKSSLGASIGDMAKKLGGFFNSAKENEKRGASHPSDINANGPDESKFTSKNVRVELQAKSPEDILKNFE